MDKHVRVASTLNIIFGVVGALAVLLIWLAGGGPEGVYLWTDDRVLGFLAAGITILQLAVSVPCIIGGLGARRLRQWGRIVLIVASAINTLNLPLGTILGAYTLWVMLAPETEPLFFDTQEHVRRAGRI